MSGPEDSTDEYTALLLRAQGGDSQAFANLYAALRPVVSDFVACFGRQPSAYDHEDVIQEVFLRAWGNLSSFRGEASAKTFILAIAKNVALKHMSKRHRLPIAYTGDLSYVSSRDTSGQRELDSDEIAPVIEQAMAQLTETQRQVVQFAIIRCLPRSEALKLANCGANQFQKRLQRALETLRRLLRNLPRCILL